ncbi:hypothetical protein C5167_039903 [Papaver somniferum]|uniref:Uncharacterized protein n=1 Tax=Papaver somniferum TaxID=3469 RepID=A0A4Y7IGX7_PAPSO|nr:hypothetical protein C5167_039903 [Papaver somniferum]
MPLKVNFTRNCISANILVKNELQRVNSKLLILVGQFVRSTVGGPCVAHWITCHLNWALIDNIAEPIVYAPQLG